MKYRLELNVGVPETKPELFAVLEQPHSVSGHLHGAVVL